jgi:hypothetical protein
MSMNITITDSVLQDAARMLRSAARKTKTAARYDADSADRKRLLSEAKSYIDAALVRMHR